MASTYNRPRGLKYTDMAIYIDEHLKDITEFDVNYEVEAKVYEYLYHIIYALSYKAGYFKSMDDYDSFALYGAGELYVSMRKKQLHAGEEKRGRLVKPIKSSLNYIKSVLFPLKINYQREHFSQVLNPDVNQDTSILIDNIKHSIQSQYTLPHERYYAQAVEEIKIFLYKVLDETPFRNDKKMRKRIYFSVILTLLDQLTLPNALKNKRDNALENSKEVTKNLQRKITDTYVINNKPAILWHLDKSYSNYIKVLIAKVKKEFSQALNSYIEADELSDEVLTDIMYTAYENFNNSGDFD